MTLLPESFYQTCLDHYRDVTTGHNALAEVVSSSIPIPFFGDVAAYLSSGVRIVTVGLNPSHKEFEVGRRRFDVSRGLSGAEGLESTLSEYFKMDPYNNWFHSYEAVLSGIGASYFPIESKYRKTAISAAHTALHIDVCSPIATDPTWSNAAMLQTTRNQLKSHGNRIFKCLIDLLQPDIVIASVALVHLKAVHHAFSDTANWKEIDRHDSTANGKSLKSALLVKALDQFDATSGKRQLLIMGSAADIPFGRFSELRKHQAGQRILAEWLVLIRN